MNIQKCLLQENRQCISFRWFIFKIFSLKSCYNQVWIKWTIFRLYFCSEKLNIVFDAWKRTRNTVKMIALFSIFNMKTATNTRTLFPNRKRENGKLLFEKFNFSFFYRTISKFMNWIVHDCEKAPIEWKKQKENNLQLTGTRFKLFGIFSNALERQTRQMFHVQIHLNVSFCTYLHMKYYGRPDIRQLSMISFSMRLFSSSSIQTFVSCSFPSRKKHAYYFVKCFKFDEDLFIVKWKQTKELLFQQ